MGQLICHTTTHRCCASFFTLVTVRKKFYPKHTLPGILVVVNIIYDTHMSLCARCRILFYIIKQIERNQAKNIIAYTIIGHF
jgi:hypothetical protein